MVRHKKPITCPLERLGINSYSFLPCNHTIMPFQEFLNFSRCKHLLRLFVQGTNKGKYPTRWQQYRISSLVFSLTPFWQILILNRSRYFQNVYPSQKKLTLPKSMKVHLRQNILAILSHNRINISEQNSETHVIRLQDGRLPNNCTILLERGAGDAQNVTKIADSQLKPTTISSE